MALRVRFSRRARGDLANIYKFGTRRFGQKQADSYLLDLLDHCDTLCADNVVYPTFVGVERTYRRSIFKSHAVYHRREADEVVIYRILGRQDTRATL